MPHSALPAEQPSLGCVLTIRDRAPTTLRRTLQTFAFQDVSACDRVLLDYGSTLRYSRQYEPICGAHGWRYVKHVPARPGWNLADATNRAVAALDEAVMVVFKSDVDVLLGDGVLRRAVEFGRDKLVIFSCYAAPPNASFPDSLDSPERLETLFEEEPGPQPMPGEGIHAFPSEWFREIGGYDRRLRGWGFEDSDLRLRAERSIGVVRVDGARLIHQWHPRTTIAKNAQRNRRLYEKAKRSILIVRNRGRLTNDRDRREHDTSGERPLSVERDVDFVVKSFLRPRAVLRLLTSIRRFYPRARVTIGDDGGLVCSADADSRRVVETVASDPHATLLELPINVGPSVGRNLLVEHTRRPYLLLLDDDFCFTSETKIELMLERLDADPHLGVVGGRCLDLVKGRRRERRFAGMLEIRDSVIHHTISATREHAPGPYVDIVLHFALFRRAVFHDVRWSGGPGGHHYDFFLQLMESRWKAAHDDRIAINHYPRTRSLPGYRHFRNRVRPAQLEMLDAWNADELRVNGNVAIHRATHLAEVAARRLPTEVPRLNGVRLSDWTIGPCCWLFLKSLLRPGMRTLECGSGESTRLFEAAGCEHVALEHDSSRAADFASVKLCPLSGNPLWYAWRPKGKPFDVVLIDGPPAPIGRGGVLRVLRDCVKPDTVVVVDDVHRAADSELASKIASSFEMQMEVYDDAPAKQWAVLHAAPLSIRPPRLATPRMKRKPP